MGTFTVPTTLSNPGDPDRRITIDLIVDTGAADTVNRRLVPIVSMLA